MRESVISAGGGEWTPQSRSGVESALLPCAGLFERVAELQAAADNVAKRADMREVQLQMGNAISVLHHEALRLALAKAEALRMAASPLLEQAKRAPCPYVIVV